MDLKEQVEQLQKQVEELKTLINKDKFSNLVVNRTPVEFKRPNIYPEDNTAIATSTTDSTGRIPIVVNGTTVYIPYF
jgi:hypothetical protein